MFDNLKKKTEGRTSYNNSVVYNIVVLAISEVEGVAFNKEEEEAKKAKGKKDKYIEKIKIDLDGNNVYIDLSLCIYEGYSVPTVAFKVQEAVRNGIENMTSFKLSSVDVRIIGIEHKKTEE